MAKDAPWTHAAPPWAVKGQAWTAKDAPWMTAGRPWVDEDVDGLRLVPPWVPEADPWMPQVRAWTPAELMAQIKTAETDATSGGTGQETGGGAMRAGTQTKADLYDELYEDLRAINRTAKAIAADVPGLDEKFRMPRSPSYSQVLTSARAFLADATPLAASFIEYEMPAEFLTDLAADIAAFEAAEDNQGAGLTNRVGATRSVAEAIMAGIAALRKLDPLLRNKYRNDPVKLAEWFSASRVERTAAKATPAPAA